MASSTPNTILLSVNGAERPYNERLAGAALTPGEILEISTGEALVPHATAFGPLLSGKLVCIENPYASDNTASAINNDWASGATARFIHAQSGDEVYVFVEASTTVVLGRTLLASDGAGALEVVVPSVDGTIPGCVFGVAMENKTVGASRERVKVRVI